MLLACFLKSIQVDTFPSKVGWWKAAGTWILAVQMANAADKIKLGIFSLATEAGWGASFELKDDGTAVVMPPYDGEREDGSMDPKPKMEHLKASWKEVKGGIEIAYLHRRDRFRLERECKDWEEYRCFRYEKSVEGSDDKSLLKFDRPYVNWTWKNPGKPKVVQAPDATRCKSDCKKMSSDGILKKGITVDQCVQATCK